MLSFTDENGILGGVYTCFFDCALHFTMTLLAASPHWACSGARFPAYPPPLFYARHQLNLFALSCCFQMGDILVQQVQEAMLTQDLHPEQEREYLAQAGRHSPTCKR